MKFAISGALLAVLMGTTAIAADLTPQPVAPLTVDVASLQTAYRASKIIGANVTNDKNEKIGTINDLLINRSDNVPYAVLSVGGFLGVGAKYVAVPYKSLKIGDDKLVLSGGSKEALQNMPEFKYQTD